MPLHEAVPAPAVRCMVAGGRWTAVCGRNRRAV